MISWVYLAPGKSAAMRVTMALAVIAALAAID